MTKNVHSQMCYVIWDHVTMQGTSTYTVKTILNRLINMFAAGMQCIYTLSSCISHYFHATL